MQMLNKSFLILSLLISTQLSAQEIGLGAKFFVFGPYNTTYDFMLGADYKHALLNKKKINVGLIMSAYTNLGPTHSRVLNFSAKGYTAFAITSKLPKLQCNIAIGAYFWDERLAIELSERAVVHPIQDINAVLSLNFSYKLRHWGFYIGGEQYGLNGTVVNSGISYKIFE